MALMQGSLGLHGQVAAKLQGPTAYLIPFLFPLSNHPSDKHGFRAHQDSTPLSGLALLWDIWSPKARCLPVFPSVVCVFHL